MQTKRKDFQVTRQIFRIDQSKREIRRWVAFKAVESSGITRKAAQCIPVTKKERHEEKKIQSLSKVILITMLKIPMLPASPAHRFYTKGKTGTLVPPLLISFFILNFILYFIEITFN